MSSVVWKPSPQDHQSLSVKRTSYSSIQKALGAQVYNVPNPQAMSSTAKIFLLGLAASLFQSAAGQAVLYPYNCNSAVPVCQRDCVKAVQNICSGAVGPLTAELSTTVNGCSARYSPYNGVPDSNVTCLASFENILATSNAAASTCNGQSPTRVGGVIAMDTNGKYVQATSYGIFPANNNPNCVVHPGQIHAPVPAQHSLFGTVYDCSSGKDVSVTGPGHINTRRGWQCPVSITAAGLCSSACILGIWAT